MKYGLGIKLLISFSVGGIAVLYKMRADPKRNRSEISTVVKVPNPFLFKFLTKPANVPSYFSWVTLFEEVDEGKKLSIEKSYRGTLDLPFLGQHQIRYYISDLEDGKWIVLKPDRVRKSYLNPEIVIMVNSISKSESQFYMKVIYHRYSALFQLTLGPVLKRLTDAQLDRVANRVREMATSNWKKWQQIHASGTKKAGNSTKSTSRVVIKKASEASSSSYWTPGELESRKKDGSKTIGEPGHREL